MKDLRIDREQAIKVAAIVGLLILAISILPGLLRAPEPPDLPPDVGFRPSEVVSQPSPHGVAKPDFVVPSDKPKAPTDRGRTTPGSSHRETKEKQPRNAPDRRQSNHKAVSRAPNQPIEAPEVPDPVPAPAPAMPAPAPPPPTLPVAPSPPPPDPEPALPGDGSEEFAPH
ncbi:MAG: hypothetical protein WBW62_08740 [Solirubrobacterales bacterium]